METENTPTFPAGNRPTLAIEWEKLKKEKPPNRKKDEKRKFWGTVFFRRKVLLNVKILTARGGR